MTTISNSKITQPYAEALFQLGLSLYFDESKADMFFQILFDLQNFLALISTTPLLNKYLANPLIPDKDKKNILKKCLRKKANIHTKNFLDLLVDKKRIGFVKLILQGFLEKSYEFLCLRFVEVRATQDLNKKQRSVLANKIRMMFGPAFEASSLRKQYPNMTITVTIEKEILGGLIIKIGSKIIDLSLRGELEQLAQQLDVTI